jgi:hypothetical protein
MKKAIALAGLALVLVTGSVAAQTAVKQKTSNDVSKTKIKPTTTIGDKAHNVVHPSHKKSHGVKWKHKNKLTNKKTKVEVKKD